MYVAAYETSSNTENFLLDGMRCLWIMFVTAVCFVLLLKLTWPKNKNIYDLFLRVFNETLTNQQRSLAFLFPFISLFACLLGSLIISQRFVLTHLD